MKLQISLSSVLFLLTFATPAFAQRVRSEETIYEVRCYGHFYNEPAHVLGVKKYMESWGPIDDIVLTEFAGNLYTPRGTFPLRYENGTGDLFITNPPTTVQVENYRGEGMKIRKFFSLKGTVLGEFDCQWTLIERKAS